MWRPSRGFTLIEILIALFIFTIVSMVLITALHSVISAQAGTEKNAERLRQLQMVLLKMSRDIEQTVNRPALNANGREEAAFIGLPQRFVFTHAGYANPISEVAHSSLERSEYAFAGHSLSLVTWTALDQAPTSPVHTRQLLPNVTAAHFQYLDNTGHFRDAWPTAGQNEQPLPRAVRVSLTISGWGTIRQLYVISAQTSNIK